MSDELLDIRWVFHLPPSLGKLLELLLNEPRVSIERIEAEVAKNGKITVLRLRRYLEPYGIEIKSMRSYGYWLEDDAKAAVRKAIADRIASHRA